MLSYNQIIKISKMFIDGDDLSPDKTIFDHIELDDDQWNYTLLNCPPTEFIYSNSDIDFTKYYESPLSPKSQIRHHDCMWSGRCTTHPEKLQCNNVVKTKSEQIAKKATQNNDTQQQQQQPQQTQQQTIQPKKNQQETIPAGQSLLINSRLNQPKPAIIKVPSVSTNDFLKDREYIARPDTPLSLDDDPPEFKHTTDVSACTMGSNRMSLVPDNETPTEIINLLKEHLEDTSLQVKNSKLHSLLPGSKADSLSDFLKDIKTLSDYEDLDGEDSIEENESDSDSNGNAASGVSSYDYSQTTHSDHSYTRSKNRVDVIGLGVQTDHTSDSEEEIDVVSVGEKALPTNPTAKDRRALQTTVAHKISNRIVKTSSGVRTIPPRRRYSVESENSANTTPSKSFGSLSHSFVKYGNIDSGTAPTNRKRQLASRDERTASNKRYRGKKQHHHQQQQQQQQQQQLQQQQHRSPVKRAATSDTDETETIEKRNLHNNMERQRRIGLKNLFEELKRQIPNLKDKDRAPKVSILREAANLCRRFNKEEEEKIALRKIQAKLYNRVSVLRTSLAAQRSRYLD